MTGLIVLTRPDGERLVLASSLPRQYEHVYNAYISWQDGVALVPEWVAQTIMRVINVYGAIGTDALLHYVAPTRKVNGVGEDKDWHEQLDALVSVLSIGGWEAGQHLLWPCGVGPQARR